MHIDIDKIDETVLALLYLTLHGENRAWKSLDWDTMNRLTRRTSSQTPSAKPNRSPSLTRDSTSVSGCSKGFL
jgi:hypothetical protein